MSDMTEELEPRRMDVRTALAAVFGLACMFGGIWLSDGAFLGAAASEAGTLAMRVCTLGVYFGFFLIARWFSRRDDGDVRWLFGIAAVVGLVLFAVGALASLLVMPQLERGGAAWSAVGMAALFAVKCVGAPVSVGLVCLFARLDGGLVVRACTLGMLGAFALYSLFSQSWAALPLSAAGVVAVAGALLTASLVLAMLGFGGVPPRALGGQRRPVVDVLAVPGVVKRPIGKVVTPGFIIMLVFSAMMLGFLRNGFTGGDYHNDPVSFVALAALLVVAFAWRGLRVEHVFYGALLCTAVGILLAPSVAWALPGLERVMCGLGTALFEVVSFVLVVWAARNSVEVLVAAAGARLAATVGHLLGTVVVAVGMVLAATPADALFASEQLMVFIYLVLLMVLLKFPSLQAPFAAAGDASEYAVESAGAAAIRLSDGDIGGVERGDLTTADGAEAEAAGVERRGRTAAPSRACGACGADAAAIASAGAMPLRTESVCGAAVPALAGAGDPRVACEVGFSHGDAGGSSLSVADSGFLASNSGVARTSAVSAGVPVPLMPTASSAAGPAIAGAEPARAAVPADPVSVPCDTIARTYRLTAREREVLGLIAHGRNMPFMEQELVISRNTLKMHIRHIYTKLDVHSKQEIIDMVEALIAR